MGIGDVGWSEFLFIIVLALIFLGPRRLPEVANAIGRSLREFRRALNEVQDELRRETQIPSVREGLWNRKLDATIEPGAAPPKDAAKDAAPEGAPGEPEADRPEPPSSES
ncbi:MAG: Sec-independent protein translocase protein TatB [Gemmatimonadota bacterium]